MVSAIAKKKKRGRKKGTNARDQCLMRWGKKASLGMKAGGRHHRGKKTCLRLRKKKFLWRSITTSRCEAALKKNRGAKGPLCWGKEKGSQGARGMVGECRGSPISIRKTPQKKKKQPKKKKKKPPPPTPKKKKKKKSNHGRG